MHEGAQKEAFMNAVDGLGSPSLEISGVEAASVMDKNDGKLCTFCRGLLNDCDSVVEKEDSQWSLKAVIGAPIEATELSEEPKVVRMHHPTIRALTASVVGSCPFCALLFQAFKDDHADDFTAATLTLERYVNGHLWLY